MAHKIDLTGNRYGRLTVLQEDGKTNHGDLRWLCKCDCGNIKTITGSKLKRGWTKSCGCIQKEWASRNMSTHKMSNTTLYNVWLRIKSRCYYPKNNRYHRYGGRGIKMCPEWLDFTNFYNWSMNNGYKEGLTIERIDIDKDYEPSNCCWIPLEEQARNKSNTVWRTYQSRRMCMAQFSRETGISINVIRNRLKKGLSGDQMVEEYRNAIS